MKIKAIFCVVPAFLAFIILLVTHKSAATGFVFREEPAMGTFVKITIEKSKGCEKLLDESFGKIKELERKFSIYGTESEINRLNNLRRMQVSDGLLFLIKKSIEISSATEGAFDITVLPLINLYRNAEKEGIPPSDIRIGETVNRIGWQKIEIKGRTVEIPCEIDMGGIAKGYIVDKTAGFLKDKGVENALINAGGDIYCFGKNPKGGKWSIGIQDPFKKDAVKKIIHVTECGIATSGDYERHLMIKGEKYGHIVNPKTGKSVQDFPAGVTVVARDAATADALATAFYVLGVEESIELAEGMENVEVMLIDGKGTVFESANFSNLAAP
ncbi:MAG: FAD:protein FMN transferase [Candidatus Omnitrophica bacterium]|nr:FAD:protein FMN transferase [Candidatus Omnitrophota bacterium]